VIYKEQPIDPVKIQSFKTPYWAEITVMPTQAGILLVVIRLLNDENPLFRTLITFMMIKGHKPVAI
jgi:hypothetical protein